MVSSSVSIELRMAPPWWFWWPIVLSYIIFGLGMIYLSFHLRERYLRQQRTALQREVDLRTKEIREAQAALHLQATQDSLTKLLSRSELQSRLLTNLSQEPQRSCFTVGLLDLDHFKNINDRFGHLAGDEILAEIGRRLRNGLKNDEYAGRYGGEEILIVVEGQADYGLERMQALKLACCSQAFDHDENYIVVTCSIGLAVRWPDDDWKSLIGRADRALYRAKRAGRDRIVSSQVEPLGSIEPAY